MENKIEKRHSNILCDLFCIDPPWLKNQAGTDSIYFWFLYQNSGTMCFGRVSKLAKLPLNFCIDYDWNKYFQCTPVLKSTHRKELTFVAQ